MKITSYQDEWKRSVVRVETANGEEMYRKKTCSLGQKQLNVRYSSWRYLLFRCLRSSVEEARKSARIASKRGRAHFHTRPNFHTVYPYVVTRRRAGECSLFPFFFTEYNFLLSRKHCELASSFPADLLNRITLLSFGLFVMHYLLLPECRKWNQAVGV